MYQDKTMYNYMALYVAIVWYVQITPEQAFRIVENRSNMKKMYRIVTPELAAKIRKICSSPCFWNMDRLCKRFGVDKETVIIHHLICKGTVDEDVIAALEDKNATQNRLLNSLRVRIKNAKKGMGAV